VAGLSWSHIFREPFYLQATKGDVPWQTKIKPKVGDATGNDDMKRDGQEDQVEGKVLKGVGDAKEKM